MSRRELIQQLKSVLHFLKESDFIVLEGDRERITSNAPSRISSQKSGLEEIASRIAKCRKCRLAEARINTVPGDGPPDARLVFVGEAPGYYEDQQGVPFVGKAGQFLDRLLSGIGLSRKDVFICNVVKCRPPKNRDPLEDEIQSCEPYLLEQLDILEPRVICALGRYAAQTLLRSRQGISRLRGRFHTYHGIPLMPTFHPASVLRNPGQLEAVEQDFQQIAGKLKESQD